MANVTQEELDTRLAELAEGLGLSVKEFVEGGFLDKSTYATDKSAIESRLDALDKVDAGDGVETLVERLEALRDLFENADGDLVQGILTSIATNTGAVATLNGDDTVEGSVAKQVKDVGAASKAITDGLETRLAVEEGKSTDAKTAADAVRVELDAVKVESLDTKTIVDILKGDDTVGGSVAKSVKDAVAAEEARTKGVTGLRADLSTTEKGTIVGAINEVNGKADSAISAIATLNGDDTVAGSVAKAVKDATGGDISDLSGRMDAAEGSIVTLNADVATEGSVDFKIEAAKGLLEGQINSVDTKATDAGTAAAAAQGGVDLNTAALETLNGDDTVVGSVAKAVKDATGGDITDLKGRVEAEEAESLRLAGLLEDTTDADDNVVKGALSKLSDAEAAIEAEVANRVADIAAKLAEAKAYTDEFALGTPQIQALNICGHVNTFRGALGLGSNDCDGSGDAGDGDGL